MPSGDSEYILPLNGSTRNQPMPPLTRKLPARYQAFGDVLTVNCRLE